MTNTRKEPGNVAGLFVVPYCFATGGASVGAFLNRPSSAEQTAARSANNKLMAQSPHVKW
jgi:hypothetical protein